MVARARERRYVRVGGGTIADDVVVGDQRRACVGCGGIVNRGKLLDLTGELT